MATALNLDGKIVSPRELHSDLEMKEVEAPESKRVLTEASLTRPVKIMSRLTGCDRELQVATDSLDGVM
jgi:hypothetical protein